MTSAIRQLGCFLMVVSGVLVVIALALLVGVVTLGELLT